MRTTQAHITDDSWIYIIYLIYCESQRFFVQDDSLAVDVNVEPHEMRPLVQNSRPLI